MKKISSKKKVFYIAAIVVVVLLIVSGIMYVVNSHNKANSSDRAGSTASSSIPANATTRAPVNGTVHISQYSNGDGVGSTVLLSGAIGDFGEAISIYPNGALNLEHNSEMNLALNQGSFRLNVADIDKNVVNAFTHFQANPNTCSGNLTAKGTAMIVAGSGTGAYKGVSGSFDLTVTVDEIDKACSGNDAFLAQSFITLGSGNVTFN